jgi:hypothetical protein
MTTIGSRTTLCTIFLISFLTALVGDAYSGEYFTYRDRDGKLVISNKTPPAGSKIIKKQTLSEVTDLQIAESETRDETTGLANRLAALEHTVGELADNLRISGDTKAALEQGGDDTNIAVGVTQAPTIVTKPPRRTIPHPIHPALPASPSRGRRAVIGQDKNVLGSSGVSGFISPSPDKR